jgi:hypothetical protein
MWLVDPDPDPGRPKSRVVDPNADRDPDTNLEKIIPDPGSSGYEMNLKKTILKN